MSWRGYANTRSQDFEDLGQIQPLSLAILVKCITAFPLAFLLVLPSATYADWGLEAERVCLWLPSERLAEARFKLGNSRFATRFVSHCATPALKANLGGGVKVTRVM